MRVTALDSIRGLGACVVVFTHFYFVLFLFHADIDPWLLDTPLHWLIAGRAAVILFFVLSGFVLALPYAQAREDAYLPYLVKRFCRIWLPCAGAVGVVALVCLWLGIPKPSWEGGDGWMAPVTWGLVGKHLLMTGVGLESKTLIPPMWSLIVEMRVSIFFPLIALAVRRFGLWAVLASVAACWAANEGGALYDGGYYIATSWLGVVPLTLYYSVFFFMGAYVACKCDMLCALMRRVPRYAHVLLVVAVVLCVPTRFFFDRHVHSDLFLAVVGLYIILGAQTSAVVARWLNVAPLLWLGRVSYSLYLVHMPVIMGFVFVWGDEVWLPLLLLLSVPVMLLCAQAAHVCFERPAQRLGRKLASKLA